MTATELKALIDANYPNNILGLITPSKEREVLKAIVDSLGQGSGVIDGLVSLGNVVTSGNDITIESAEARINGDNYATVTPTVITVPPPSTGTTRRDIIVLNTSSDIVLVQGVETTEVAITPSVPSNAVLLLETLSTDSGVSEALESALTSFVRLYGNDTRTGTLTNNGAITVNAAGGIAINTLEDGSASGKAFSTLNTNGGGMSVQRRGSVIIRSRGDSVTDYFILRLQDNSPTPNTVWEVRAGGVTSGGDAVNDNDYPTWGQVKNQVATGQTTKLSSENFFLGQQFETIEGEEVAVEVTYAKGPKDLIITDGGTMILDLPEMKNLVFTREANIIGVRYAVDGSEFSGVNRSGKPLTFSNTGTEANTQFLETHIWQDGESFSYKAVGGYWVESENNKVGLSSHLNTVHSIRSLTADGNVLLSNVFDNTSLLPITLKKVTTYLDGSAMDDLNLGVVYHKIGSEYFANTKFLNERVFNTIDFGADPTGVSFSDAALDKIKLLHRDGDKIVFPHGSYRFGNNLIINKGVDFDGGRSIFTFESQNSLIFTGVEKSTHTVTANYLGGNGRNFLSLNNTTGIEKGDIINIISTELYDTSRTYNYKGGNFLVISKSGNTVFFDRAMPFDMASGSITVKIYKPSKVNLYNIPKLTNTRPVATNFYGIRLMYCSMSKLENINTENSRYNIDIWRCVGVELNNISTGHAKDFSDSAGGDYDAYGVAIESSTDITCNNVRTNSGQHGVTTGGQEPCYNLVFHKTIFKSENSTLAGVGPGSGFGAHANLYNATFTASTFHGILLSGNCTIDDCDLYTQDETNSILGNINVSDDPKYSNYTFNNTRFNGILRLRDTAQVMTNGRKYVGIIKFDNCTGVHLRTEVNLLTTVDKVAEIDTIEFNKCKNVRLYLYDKAKILNFDNVEKNPTDRLVTMENVEGRLCGAENVDMKNVSIIGSSYAVGFRLINCRTVIIDNLICPVGNSATTYPGEIFGAENLVIENTDTTPVLRPFSLSGINIMKVVNSDINSDTNGYWDTFIETPTSLITDRLKRVSNGLIYNYITSTAGIKYNQQIDAEGRINVGSRKLAFHQVSLVKSGRLNTLDLTYLHKHIRCTYVGASNNIDTIPPNIFAVDDELNGEVEGSAKTFAAGEGVTLRSADGQGLVAPTGSRFLIKFKSPNDALVTIIKPYTFSAVPDSSTTVKGLIEQATPTESIAGTSSVLAVTPEGMQAKFNDIITYGTYTPIINAGSANPTLTYTTQFGTWRRVGQIVNFDVRIEWTAITGAGSGEIGISLPVGRNVTESNSALIGGLSIGFCTGIAIDGQIFAAYRGSLTGVRFSKATGAFYTVSDLNSAGILCISGSYRASS